MSSEPKATDGTTLRESVPTHDMPREKLIKSGRASLSDEELIALFLRTGLPGCNVLELARKLKKDAGSLAQLGRMEALDIMKQCKGIGPAKAATLAAVFELGARAVRETLNPLSITSAEQVYDFLAAELRFAEQEHMYVLLLSVRNELIRCVQIGVGTLNSVISHPREIYREAIRYSASRIILVHNHPSGVPTPSEQDFSLTRDGAAAGKTLRIPLLDHVVIGAPTGGDRKAYYSFKEHQHL